MKLHVYQQHKSNITWTRDDPFTEAEMLDINCKFTGYVDSEDYEPIGMGYYRKSAHHEE